MECATRNDSIAAIVESVLKVNREKRKSTRISLQGSVRVTLDSQTVEGELVNISLHGALVTSKRFFDLHSCVVVNIFDQGSSRSITGVKAKVVRVTANSMALAFEKAEHPAPMPRT